MTTLANGYESVAAQFLAGRSASVGVQTVQAWARALPPHADVLELGCGAGVPLTKILVDEGHVVYGIDASPTLVAAFRENLPGVMVACESVEASTFFQRSFDAVLAWGLWFLLPEATQRELLQRVAAVLRPGGRLLFTAPEQACTWRDAMTGEASRSLGAAAYRDAMSALGLSLLAEYDDEGENHYYDAVKSP